VLTYLFPELCSSVEFASTDSMNRRWCLADTIVWISCRRPEGLTSLSAGRDIDSTSFVELRFVAVKWITSTVFLSGILLKNLLELGYELNSPHCTVW